MGEDSVMGQCSSGYGRTALHEVECPCFCGQAATDPPSYSIYLLRIIVRYAREEESAEWIPDHGRPLPIAADIRSDGYSVVDGQPIVHDRSSVDAD